MEKNDEIKKLLAKSRLKVNGKYAGERRTEQSRRPRTSIGDEFRQESKLNSHVSQKDTVTKGISMRVYKSHSATAGLRTSFKSEMADNAKDDVSSLEKYLFQKKNPYEANISANLEPIEAIRYYGKQTNIRDKRKVKFIFYRSDTGTKIVDSLPRSQNSDEEHPHGVAKEGRQFFGRTKVAVRSDQKESILPSSPVTALGGGDKRRDDTIPNQNSLKLTRHQKLWLNLCKTDKVPLPKLSSSTLWTSGNFSNTFEEVVMDIAPGSSSPPKYKLESGGQLANGPYSHTTGKGAASERAKRERETNSKTSEGSTSKERENQRKYSRVQTAGKKTERGTALKKAFSGDTEAKAATKSEEDKNVTATQVTLTEEYETSNENKEKVMSWLAGLDHPQCTQYMRKNMATDNIGLQGPKKKT